ncbi:Uncharacterised protein [Clostridioides difficile]|nr:Uncharacterised protein [Clostridioides difficile]
MGGFDGVATLVHLARGGEIGESHETPYTLIADDRIARCGGTAPTTR